jgi:hypothetical protein
VKPWLINLPERYDKEHPEVLSRESWRSTHPKWWVRSPDLQTEPWSDLRRAEISDLLKSNDLARRKERILWGMRSRVEKYPAAVVKINEELFHRYRLMGHAYAARILEPLERENAMAALDTALMRAIEKFNPNHVCTRETAEFHPKAGFATYAGRFHLRPALNCQPYTKTVRKHLKQIGLAETTLSVEGNHHPTDEEIANHLHEKIRSKLAERFGRTPTEDEIEKENPLSTAQINRARAERAAQHADSLSAASDVE